jgi:hypothetical protein
MDSERRLEKVAAAVRTIQHVLTGQHLDPPEAREMMEMLERARISILSCASVEVWEEFEADPARCTFGMVTARRCKYPAGHDGPHRCPMIPQRG